MIDSRSARSGHFYFVLLVFVALLGTSVVNAQDVQLELTIPEPAPEELNRSRIRNDEVLPQSEPQSRSSRFDVELPASEGTWQARGPSPTRFGQVENVGNFDEVVGAVHTVLAHPDDANIVWMGAVNGGVWRTDNATAELPNWVPLTDNFSSLSIGALQLDKTDTTYQTLIAGIGRFSSFAQLGGQLTGLLKTTDGGATWREIGREALLDRNISGVSSRGSTLVVAANTFASGTSPGIYQSTDDGETFSYLSVTGGIEFGEAFDLVEDPADVNRLYAGLAVGVFRSDDGGATWVDVNSAEMNLLFDDPVSGINNVEIAVHHNSATGTHAVYAAVMDFGQLAGLYRSDDSGASWRAMDIPQTNEGGDVVGLQPRSKPGSQGGIHFAIVADPDNQYLVYVGGDRQPTADGLFPNSIGAVNFTGRLFRGDASIAPTGQVPSPQWEHLTHLNDVVETPGGGTASSSAPHADAREMDFDANGDLIEGDDGGIYRRTSPRDNTGDWFSMNGDAQITEMHNVAYDAVSDILIGGSQDTGTHEQLVSNGLVYQDVLQADGGDVAVDDQTVAGQSIRYQSFQFLGFFNRRTCDANNNCSFPESIGLREDADSPPIAPQFTNPVELNAVDKSRLVLGGTNGVFESFNRGDDISKVTGSAFDDFFDPLVSSLVYGHVNNPDLLVVGANFDVYVRQSLTDNLEIPTILPSFELVRDVAVDPVNENIFYALTVSEVFQSVDAGQSWLDITGNLEPSMRTEFRTINVVREGNAPRILIGGQTGAFFASTLDPSNWSELGQSLPNAPVWDMEYETQRDLLVVSTLGRGIWSLDNISTENLAPVFDCQNVTVPTLPGQCLADETTAIPVVDPDGDSLQIDKEPPGPLQLGENGILLIAQDSGGLMDLCDTTVTVVDSELPEIDCNSPATIPRSALPLTINAVFGDNCSVESRELSGIECVGGSCQTQSTDGSLTIVSADDQTSAVRWSLSASDGSNEALENCEIGIEGGKQSNPLFSVAYTEVNEGDGVVNVMIRAKPAPTVATTVGFFSRSVQSAKPGSDFFGLFRVVEFKPGQTVATVPIQILDDDVAEPREKFIVRIVNASTGRIEKGQAVIHINDNDNP